MIRRANKQIDIDVFFMPYVHNQVTENRSAFMTFKSTINHTIFLRKGFAIVDVLFKHRI